MPEGGNILCHLCVYCFMLMIHFDVHFRQQLKGNYTLSMSADSVFSPERPLRPSRDSGIGGFKDSARSMEALPRGAFAVSTIITDFLGFLFKNGFFGLKCHQLKNNSIEKVVIN